MQVLAFLFACHLSTWAQSGFTEAEIANVKAFLREHFRQTNSCIVIGMVDERGQRTFGAGELGDGTRREPDGDTLFFIGSASKTFTALLLQDAVQRGEMKLDDPVVRYLPLSVNAPAYQDKHMTLFDLATHTGGFPINPDNMTGGDIKEQYETYTVEKMYAYVSSYALARAPGTEFEYSNLGMALLGHAIARSAGTNFESVLVERICRPLGMDSTRITLTPELKGRLAMGRDSSGKPSSPWKFQAYSPAGDIHSTANDLLKFLSAQVGLKPSGLAPAMENTHVLRFTDKIGLRELPSFGNFGRTGMGWVQRGAYQPPGMELLGHAGGAGSYHAWIGIDKKQRRGVVVMTTASGYSPEAIGWTLLQRLPLKPGSRNEFAREIFGLGFLIGVDSETSTLRVTKVFSNSPASRAGVFSGMIIHKIDGVPTAQKSIVECQRLFRADGIRNIRLDLIDTRASTTNTVEVSRGLFLISG